MSVPSLPPIDELEDLAASATPSMEGAWWITTQVGAHVLNAAGPRDRHTGEPLPSSLLLTLRRIEEASRTGVRPLPADRLQQAVEFLRRPLRHILEHARTRIVRKHVLLPLHRLREMDAKCLDWLGRQPGRTVREKLASRPSALGMVRDFTPNTQENRVVHRVVRLLERLVTGRLEGVASGGYDPADGAFLESLRDCHVLCTDEFRRSPLADVPLGHSSEPNNVLLNDRDYSRVWRAWQWLRGHDEDVASVWDGCEEQFRAALFWALVARLAALPPVWMCDTLARVEAGQEGVGHGLSHLSHDRDNPVWMHAPQVGLVVEATLPTSHHCWGTVRWLAQSANGPYGFITGADGNDYYVNPRLLSPDLVWDGLWQGAVVAYRPEESRAGKNQAADVRWPIPPCLVWLSLEGDRLVIQTAPLAGTTVLGPQAELSRSLCFTLGFESKKPLARRGVVFSATREEGGKAVGVFRRNADMQGVREFAQTVLRWLSLDGFTEAPGTDTKPTASAPGRTVGLDLGTVLPRLDVDGRSCPVPSALSAVQYESPDGGYAEWLVVRSDRWSDTLTVAANVVSMSDVLDVDTELEEGQLSVASGRILEQVLAEVAGEGAGLSPGARLALAVPDTVDEFTQRVLRSAAAGAFGRCYPVWRSVALALGWQHTPAFAGAGVRPGDVVVVLDALADGLSANVLVARLDARLEQRFPATRGLYWERRPPLSRRSLPEDVGDLAQSLTLAELLRRYLHDLLSPAGTFEGQSLSVAIDHLVRTGVAEAVVCQGRPAWIPLGVGNPQQVFHLTLDAGRWKALVNEWCLSLRQFLVALAGCEIFRDLLNDAQRQGQSCHLLFAGLPFCLPAVRESVNQHLSHPALERFKMRIGPGAEDLASAGARHFLERLAEDLPSWKDWLPELYLEVVRDGHFHELQLMREELLEEEATAASLGKPLERSVPEKLTLPPGEGSFSFPLAAGRRRQLLRFDAELESTAFPLAQHMDVRMSVSYRYGLECAYDLAVIPAELGTAPFQQLHAIWKRRALPASEVPGFPRRQFWGTQRLAKYKDWFIDKSADLCHKCKRFFSSERGPEELREFADAMVEVWNRDLPELNQWKYPECQADGLKVFAEWMRRSLELPTRRLWDRGRMIGNEPEIRSALESGYVDWLSSLAQLGGATLVPAVSNPALAPGREAIRGVAILLLSRLQRDAPRPLVHAVRDILRNNDGDVNTLRFALESVSFVLGDGTRGRRACLESLLALARRVLSDRSVATDRQCEVLKALAAALWRHPQLLTSVVEADGTFVRFFLNAVEQTYNDLFIQLAKVAEAESLDSHQRFFAACGQILLAMLRLRDPASSGSRGLLRAGTPSLLRIAWLVRRIDCALAERGVSVHSGIRFDSGKPPALHRMSELAFVLHSYLTGDSRSNLIQIASIEEESGEE
jgi:hypothetical protein